MTLLERKSYMLCMNIYDTKSISCRDCGEIIGEIDFEAEVILPRCGQCSNPSPHFKDKMPYLIRH